MKFPSSARFILDTISLHISPVEWISACLRVQWTAYLTERIPEKTHAVVGYGFERRNGGGHLDEFLFTPGACSEP